MIVSSETADLTTEALNNFLVFMRGSIKQARVHLINHHSRLIKTLTTSKKFKVQNSELVPSDSAEPLDKFQKKAAKLSKEIKIVKRFSNEDLAKFVLLNDKSYNQATREKCGTNQRAVSYLSEQDGVKRCKEKFRQKFGESVKQLPFCIKVHGASKRYKKIQKLAKKGRKEDYLRKQRLCHGVLREIGGDEFLAAEELYKKFGKKNRNKQTQSANDKTSGNLSEDSSSDDEENEEVEKVLENDMESKSAVARKVHEKLDALFGKLKESNCNEESSDSDREDQNLLFSERNEMSFVETPHIDMKLSSGPPTEVCVPSINMPSILNADNIASTNNTGSKSKATDKHLRAAPSPSKKMKEFRKEKKKSTSDSSSLKKSQPSFLSSSFVKEIDLDNVQADGFIACSTLGSHCNLDALELSQGPMKKRISSNGLSTSVQDDLDSAKHESDDDDFDPAALNMRYNGKRLYDAILKKDVRKQQQEIYDKYRGGRGGGRCRNRGSSFQAYRGTRSRGRDLSRRGGIGVGGFGSRGHDGSGFGSRGREGGRFASRGRERGGFSLRGRGGVGRGKIFSRDGGQHSSRRYEERTSARVEKADRKTYSGAFANNKVDENLHPSWAAKKQQTAGIVQFQGKKVTFS